MLIGWMYVLMVVVSFGAMGLACKCGGSRGASSLGMVAILYSGAAVVCLAVALAAGSQFTWTAAWLGALSGLGGSLAFVAYVQAMRIGHFGFSSAITYASFLGAVLFAAVAWHEPLGVQRIGGIGLLVLAIFMITLSSKTVQGGGHDRWGLWIMLVAASFVLNALPQICTAACNRAGEAPFAFLFFNFLAGAVALLPLALRSGAVTRQVLGFGALAALASVAGNFGSLQALNAALPPTVVFPITLSGTVVIAVLLSLLVFREKFSWLGYAGMVCELAGIALVGT